MNYGEKWKPVFAMVGVEFGFAIVNILFKMALDAGTSHMIILVVYRQSISTVFLSPLAYFYERSSWSKLTAPVVGQIFLSALLGLTLTQYLFLVGLGYTSATFACAFINIVPVITFVLALPFGMERVNMKNNSGKAKVLGTVISVLGAILLILYKGIPLTNPRQLALTNPMRTKRWGLGSVFLSVGGLSWSSWFLIQAKVGQNYPYPYSSTSIMSISSAIQSAILCFILDRDIHQWILKGKLLILSVVYSGTVGSGMCYVVLSWCVAQRGPVFTSAFCPLIQIFAAVFDIALLHEEIYLGSILGSVVVIIGMYTLLWGKSHDEESWKHMPTKVNGCTSQDSAIEVISQ